MNDGDIVVYDVFNLVGVPVFTSEQWKTFSCGTHQLCCCVPLKCLAPRPTALRVLAVELVSLQPGCYGRRSLSSSLLGNS